MRAMNLWWGAAAIASASMISAAGCGDETVFAPPGAGGAGGAGNTTSGTGASSDGGFNIGLQGGAAATGGNGVGGGASACGDGKVTGTETCDDQNDQNGDGCDVSCAIEDGWTCPVAGAACVAKECGDGLLAGSEECDDGDSDDNDGCSATCQLEDGFKCPTPNMDCEPTTCGDGVTEGTEQCDDGNNDMGDGCTPFCVNEPDCTQGACTTSCGDGIKLPGGGEECEDGNTDAGDGCSPTCEIEPGYVCTDVSVTPTELVLPIVFRDFTDAHGDFEGPCCQNDTGIVEPTLGMDGKPVYTGTAGNPMTTGQANFDQWYRDTAGVNQTILQTITLADQGNGAYQFSDTSFFPLDGLGFGDFGNSGHNFHFTSEVRYWFEYQQGQQLDFQGDDDVFVFVNKQLVVDLGGVHGPESGSITLDASNEAALGLTPGSIYEIVVFQAERHTDGSNYILTLSNFVNATSSCEPVCGDGVKTPDEVCDDGVNDGTYGHCTVDCNFGPYCGDGNLDLPQEECDDGNEQNGDGCSAGCQDEVPT